MWLHLWEENSGMLYELRKLPCNDFAISSYNPFLAFSYQLVFGSSAPSDLLL